MKCSKCGFEFEEGIFCSECGTKYEDVMEQIAYSETTNEESPKSKTDSQIENAKTVEEEKTNHNGNKEEELKNPKKKDTTEQTEADDKKKSSTGEKAAVQKEKKPIFLSIIAIFVVFWFTAGIGSLIMTIVRMVKYPKKKKSNIVLLVLHILWILLMIWAISLPPTEDTASKTSPIAAQEETTEESLTEAAESEAETEAEEKTTTPVETSESQGNTGLFGYPEQEQELMDEGIMVGNIPSRECFLYTYAEYKALTDYSEVSGIDDVWNWVNNNTSDSYETDYFAIDAMVYGDRDNLFSYVSDYLAPMVGDEWQDVMDKASQTYNGFTMYGTETEEAETAETAEAAEIAEPEETEMKEKKEVGNDVGNDVGKSSDSDKIVYDNYTMYTPAAFPYKSKEAAAFTKLYQEALQNLDKLVYVEPDDYTKEDGKPDKIYSFKQSTGSYGDYQYYGKMKNGRPNGNGIVLEKGFPIYMGEFNKGNLEGFGILLTCSKPDSQLPSVIYEGGWKDGKYDGKGIEYLPAESIYLDYTYHDAENYLSKLTEEYEAASDYDEDFVQYEGYYVGVFGVSYEGKYSKGKMNGDGKIYTVTMERQPCLLYEGQFKKDQCTGKGKKYYPNGQLCYSGEFKNGEYNGKGTLYNEDGSVNYKGKFKNGEIK